MTKMQTQIINQEHNRTDMYFPSGQMTGILSKPIAFEHTIFLDETLIKPSDWRLELETIRNMSPSDTTILRINSGGGSDSVMCAFTKAIAETQGTVIGSIEHLCCSAATVIWLACHQQVFSDDAEFMIHTGSSGYEGKQGDLHSYSTFYNKTNEAILRRYYKNFITEEELQDIIKGVEFWLDAEDLSARLTKKQELDKEDQVKEMKDCGCAECQASLLSIGIMPDDLLEDLEVPEKEEIMKWSKTKLQEYLIELLYPEDEESEEVVEETTTETKEFKSKDGLWSYDVLKDSCEGISCTTENYSVFLNGDTTIIINTADEIKYVNTVITSRKELSNLALELGLKVKAKDTSKTLNSMIDDYFNEVYYEYEQFLIKS